MPAAADPKTYVVNNATEMNVMLSGLFDDVLNKKLDHETVKSVTLIADKINKNNVNMMTYKNLVKHTGKIDFLEPVKKRALYKPRTKKATL